MRRNVSNSPKLKEQVSHLIITASHCKFSQHVYLYCYVMSSAHREFSHNTADTVHSVHACGRVDGGTINLRLNAHILHVLLEKCFHSTPASELIILLCSGE